jgi:hypothetical protein
LRRTILDFRWIVVGAVLLVSVPASALNRYIGVLGPFAGVGIDTNPDVANRSYLLGNRFESVNIENNISLVINAFLGLGVGLPDVIDVTAFDSSTAKTSLYSYMGLLIRYEDCVLKLGDGLNNTGLYWGFGGGAYFGMALTFNAAGEQVEMGDTDLSSARTQSMTIDPTLNAYVKFLIDFNQDFGLYPFFDYEFVPLRSYFKANATDEKPKHRFLVGVGFAFEFGEGKMI